MHDQQPNNILQESLQQHPCCRERLSKGPVRPGLSYDLGRLLGNGSFGIVCEARCLDTGEQVAVKKVLQDPRYKNRELDVMKALSHPNIVELKDYFYTESAATPTDRKDASQTQRYLNVVMEHVPETVYRVLKTFVRNSQPLPILLVRLYTYQLCRALGYIHSLGVCHRDIKPQNLLVDSRSHVLKLCDFGSAKKLLATEKSVAYICSRFYRAPELMLGATEYTTAIDLWSIGCVLGELLLGKPLFSGETSVDQLVKIIQVLGTPTQMQMHAMNPNYCEFRFPDILPKEWRRVISTGVGSGTHVPDDALNLLNSFLQYEPKARLTAYEALGHPFFDQLREPGKTLPEGSPLPELFNFSIAELQCISPKTQDILIPKWHPRRKELVALKLLDSYNGGGDVYNSSSLILLPVQSTDQQFTDYGSFITENQATGSNASTAAVQCKWE